MFTYISVMPLSLLYHLSVQRTREPKALCIVVHPYICNLRPLDNLKTYTYT